MENDQENILKAIKNGVELTRVEFIHAVNNSENMPQTYYSEKSNISGRRGNIWITPIGYIIKQNGKYIHAPAAQGKYGFVK